MGARLRWGLAGLAALDVLSGAAMVLWPGAWQEWLHPRAMGTTSYPLQAAGAVWLLRGLLAAVSAARRSARGTLAVSGAWGVEAGSAALLALRTAGAGPWAVPAHLLHMMFSVIVAVALWRHAPWTSLEENR